MYLGWLEKALEIFPGRKCWVEACGFLVHLAIIPLEYCWTYLDQVQMLSAYQVNLIGFFGLSTLCIESSI